MSGTILQSSSRIAICDIGRTGNKRNVCVRPLRNGTFGLEIFTVPPLQEIVQFQSEAEILKEIGKCEEVLSKPVKATKRNKGDTQV